jgi:endonuclease/exonuclease/phosphatase family metal-dependent hydrolase
VTHRLSRGLLLGALTLSACTRGMNYPSLDGPRYAGGPISPVTAASAPAMPLAAGVVRLVTFNVRHAEQVDSAIVVLQLTPELAFADVIALQEVDAPATERIARTLGMGYVYYPATLHPKFGRDFGNAVLSRWPIVADRKLVLPHLGRFRKTERTATAATVVIDGTPVRVYSAHLGTLAEIGPRSKRDQAGMILADAAAFPHVIVLGDMNSHGIGETFRRAGFAWPTEQNARTHAFGNWDHVFLKGIALAHDGATGVVRANRRASDHRPVWAVVATPVSGANAR